MRFFSSIGNFFKKFFQSAPTWAQQASTALTLVAPLASTVVTLAAGPEAGQEALQVAHEVQSDLAALAQLIQQSHAGDNSKVGQISAVIGSVQSNLSALLTAGHIKNADTLAKTKVVADTITGELQAILSVLPTQGASTGASA